MNVRRGALALLFLAASCVTAPQAERFPLPGGRSTTAAEIDASATRMMDAAHVPGLGLALIVDGRVVYVKSYGVRNATTNAPLDIDTVMYGASLTKAAFAYMVMTLVDEGVVDLDKSIADYLPKPLPEYEKYKDLANDPRWGQFTFRMMLSHSTGMPNFRWVNDDEKLDIKYPPGSRFVYSGEGINLAQFVLEEGLHRNVGQLMRERVFDRFGMTRTSMTWRADFGADLADGHDEAGAAVPHKQRGGVRAAGSMDTTVSDYAKFLAGVLRGDGLSATSKQTMLSSQIAIVSPTEFPSHWPGETDVNRRIDLGYGLGWGVYRSPYGPAFFKEGNGDGENNIAMGFQSSRTGLLMLANSANGEKMFEPMIDSVFGEACMPWFWQNYIPWDKPDLRLPEARNHPPSACDPPPAR